MQCSACGKELDYLVKNFCPFCGVKISTSEKFQNALDTADKEIDFLKTTEGKVLDTPQFLHDLPMVCTDETHLRMAECSAGLRKEKEDYPDIAHLSPEPSRFCHNCGKELPVL